MDDVTAPDELLATCWTTARDAAPSRGDWRTPVPLRERIEAAAAAGFTGFGVPLAPADRSLLPRWPQRPGPTGGTPGNGASSRPPRDW
ncbi:MAG: hypothetical protein JWO98_3268 [Frankiales bacterium]|nr:hypothetical protein [Frankiales bacterium]